MKDDLKELATLRGLASASDEFVAKLAGYGRQTGLTVAQADEFQRQFYGSGEAGKQAGNIDDATAEQLAVEAGKVASRQTKDVSTRGDLVGILSQFRKYDKGTRGVHQALGDAEAIRLGLTEGRGDDAPLTKSLLHVAGSLAGDKKMIGSLPELAALIGVTSLSAGPGQADTRSEQLVRGVRGETPEQVAFLKSFTGINEGENLESRLDKLVPALRKKRAEGRDVSAFLTENGVNAEQVRAITETESNYEVLKLRLAKARNGASGASIMAESERQAQFDPLQRQKIAQAELEAAKLDSGRDRQGIVADQTRGQALLVQQGLDTSMNPLTLAGNFARSAATSFQMSGLDVRAQEAAIADLQEKTGVLAPGQVPTPLDNTMGGTAIRSAVSAMFGSQVDDLKFLRSVYEAQLQTKAAIEAQTRVIAGQQKPAPIVSPGRGNAGTVR